MFNDPNCPHWGICGGCPAGREKPENLRRIKLSFAQNFFPQAAMADLPSFGLRDRVDLTWKQTAKGMKLGLYALGSREIVDFETCLMFSPALQEWFTEFRTRAPQIQQGSVRLRVSPSGEKGAWLDFANVDVRDLFAEKEYLRWLSERAVVEIGQRQKTLTWVDGAPKLVDPALRHWFDSFDRSGNPLALWGTVAGFSQVGFVANRVLVAEVLASVNASSIKNWVELFCGNGNFALALAASGFAVEAYENDPIAIQGLKKAAVNRPIQVHQADILRGSGLERIFSDRGAEEFGVLVDPPRSGLGSSLNLFLGPKGPKCIVYVSCGPEALAGDLQALQEVGYKVKSMVGVDQFPGTPLCEWVARLEKSPSS